jgi:acyl-coenzyme A synthetase/AMP-(fatty) acid ligase
VIPFSRLLVEARADADRVAFGREGPRDVRDLRADVASLAALLLPFQGGRVLLHCEDAYAFAVGLLAAGQVGARAVLPPSRQPGALRDLAREVEAALLDGEREAEPIEGRPCWHPLEAPRAEHPLAALDRDAPLVELFTSGTTGAGRPVAKAVRHLEDEVTCLEERFGVLLGREARILATPSTQHLYGLLFRVVWPLAAGRPFLRSSLLHPEELLPWLEERHPFALATTPIPLRHLAEKEVLASHSESCRGIFSSGGPLPAAVARRVAAAVGAPPWEVYGSTETGGVALRQQIHGGEPWQPLAEVEADRDEQTGCLGVTSPWVSEGEARPGGARRLVLGDLVDLDPAGGFALLGRADRVVKIGEKRLSLPVMEERLRSHPAVDDVVLVALEQAGEARVGAVVTATRAGRALLEGGGRRALAKTLTEYLSPDFDRVLLPRAWRVVETLPRDSQDKTPAARLRALFSAGSAAARLPEVLARRRKGDTLFLSLRVPEDLAYLEGHFPSFPVVAGVVQVQFAMQGLAELIGAPPRLSSLEALKFRELLGPGQAVQLQVRLDADQSRFEFTLSDPERPARVFSSGRGTLERPS